MFKQVVKNRVVPLENLSFPKERVSLVMCVDDFPSKDFNLNDAGWTANDLSKLARAQSQAEVEMILKRLAENPSTKSNLPDGVKIKDAFDMIRPRYLQTENEFVDFAERLGQKAQDNLEAAYAAIRAKQIQNAPAPAPAPAPVSAAE